MHLCHNCRVLLRSRRVQNKTLLEACPVSFRWSGFTDLHHVADLFGAAVFTARKTNRNVTLASEQKAVALVQRMTGNGLVLTEDELMQYLTDYFVEEDSRPKNRMNLQHRPARMDGRERRCPPDMVALVVMKQRVVILSPATIQK